jgi:hypothetical protein
MKSAPDPAAPPGPPPVTAAEHRACPGCGSYEDAHPSFGKLYHATSPVKRLSIGERGLQVKYHQGGGITEPGIYMSPRPTQDGDEDVWEVDTRDVRLHPDDPAQMHEFRDVGGSYFSKEDIPPDRLRLHRPGTGNKWIGYPPETAAVSHYLQQDWYHGGKISDRALHGAMTYGCTLAPARPPSTGWTRTTGTRARASSRESRTSACTGPGLPLVPPSARTCVTTVTRLLA